MTKKHLSQYEKTVLFGAGTYGEITIESLNALGFESRIECFIDNNPSKWDSSLCGIKIQPPEYLHRLDIEFDIIITMEKQDDVISQLKDMGYTYGELVFSYAEKVYYHKLAIGSQIDGDILFRPIYEGFSANKKYYVETANGNRYFLRISNVSTLADIEMELKASKMVASKGIRVPEFVDCGRFGDSTFLLLNWIGGIRLEDMLKISSNKENYEYGLRAGEVLKKIHKIPITDGMVMSSSIKFAANIANLKSNKNAHKLDNIDQILLSKIRVNNDLAKNRPKCVIHGDFYSGNIIIESSQNNTIKETDLLIIDFEFFYQADPWVDFSSAIITGHITPFFSIGVMHGYFDGNPPDEFWPLNAFYTLNSLFTHSEKRVCQEHNSANLAFLEYKSRVLSCYNNTTESNIPYWYIPISLINDSEFMSFLQKIHSLYFSRKQGFCPEFFYQGFERLHIFGLRPTEFRFNAYGLDKILTKNSAVLDISCNCGFLSLYISEFVKKVVGIEIDQALVDIAKITADYLDIGNCSFYCQDFNHFSTDERFDLIFSFAAHYWISLSIEEYSDRLVDLLNPGGIVLFESHPLRSEADRYWNFEEMMEKFSDNRFKVLHDGDILDNISRPRKFKILKLIS